jgi:hypothetical protein
VIQTSRHEHFLYPKIIKKKKTNKHTQLIEINTKLNEKISPSVLHVLLKLVLMMRDKVVRERLNEVDYFLRHPWHLHLRRQVKVLSQVAAMEIDILDIVLLMRPLDYMPNEAPFYLVSLLPMISKKKEIR